MQSLSAARFSAPPLFRREKRGHCQRGGDFDEDRRARMTAILVTLFFIVMILIEISRDRRSRTLVDERMRRGVRHKK